MEERVAKRLVNKHLKDLYDSNQRELESALRFHVFYSVLNATKVKLVNEKVDINDMTPAIWNKMTKKERWAWTKYHNLNGSVSFQCHVCGFPVASGGDWCDACEPRPKSGE